jgi:hypothetical protein
VRGFALLEHLLVPACDLAQAAEGLVDDAGDLHLADAEPLADLLSGEIFFEAWPQDLARSLGQRPRLAPCRDRADRRGDWGARALLEG